MEKIQGISKDLRGGGVGGRIFFIEDVAFDGEGDVLGFMLGEMESSHGTLMDIGLFYFCGWFGSCRGSS